MRQLSANAIGIDQGNAEIFSDFSDGGDMWTGQGPRERRKSVRFSQRYKSPPAVHVSLSMWDMDQGTNARADIAAENITEEGCELVFRTWSDSRVARVRMNWMAIGEIPNVDDWELY
jgi:hypothetical protein